MMDMLYGDDQCLRYISTLFLDGKGKKCLDIPQAAPCSRCKAVPTSASFTARDKSLLGKRARDSAVDMERFNTSQKVKDYMNDTFGNAVETSKRRRVERIEMRDDYVVKFKEALSKFEGMCSFCLVWGLEVPFHSILKCTTMVGHA